MHNCNYIKIFNNFIYINIELIQKPLLLIDDVDINSTILSSNSLPCGFFFYIYISIKNNFKNIRATCMVLAKRILGSFRVIT